MTSPTNRDARERLAEAARIAGEYHAVELPKLPLAEMTVEVSLEDLRALLSPDEVEGMGADQPVAWQVRMGLNGTWRLVENVWPFVGSAEWEIRPLFTRSDQPQPTETVESDDSPGGFKDTWSDFEGDYLTDGNGYAAADVYRACRGAFEQAWPRGRHAAYDAARQALPPKRNARSDQPLPSVATGHPEQGALLSEWQPIESAPTDGRSVLVFCPRASDHGYERIRLTWRKDGKWQGANNTSWPPTHWMPLPSSPKP